ncbi:MAG TPA: aspartate aminotransferase family protein [Porphyromonadaceae bacterium]|nr:aspartate aminotransferase family protein [Porphyromonadaceae bacterium]
MELFDVYPLFDIHIVKGKGSRVYDEKENEYLDFYGGHAVISIGHCHPEYVKALTEQAQKIGFYSNSVKNELQVELAHRLGEMCGYPDYSLFLINSGAEANENALKLASFYNGRTRIVVAKSSFHGRTSAAVNVTDNPKIIAPINKGFEVSFVPLNNIEALEQEVKKGDVCAVMVEGIQGIGGIRLVSAEYFSAIRRVCDEHNSVMIVDEIQSGYGRSGRFFAHQYANVKPDVISMAKGMGNGFPIGGILISPKFEASYGMLGTTFGGNYMACSAALSVLKVMKEENLVNNAKEVGEYLLGKLQQIHKIKEVRGKGLMIGLEFDYPIKELRTKLLFEQKVFTGVSGTHILRLLPPLCISKKDADLFVERLEKCL